MAYRLPSRGLTWYAGSLLPYTSLWHVMNRLGSLNCLSGTELPVRSSPCAGKAYLSYRHPLYHVEGSVDLEPVADALNEPRGSMQ